jgi:hypothetical protein
MTNLKIKLELLAQGIQRDESLRMICPKCNGGRTSEKSFLISRDDRGLVLYKCFRASCDLSGKLIDGLGEPGSQPKTRKLHSFTRELKPLSPDQIVWWRAKFGINPDNDVYWCPSLCRDALRVFGPEGQHRGWVLRDWTGQSEPKSIVYPERDEPFIGWYPTETTHPGGSVVVVEDLISARKVCDAGFTAVALNGTTMNWEIAFEVRETHPDMELALDRGTMVKMIEYKDKFSTMFDNISIWTLDKDLKYVSRGRIRRAMVDGEINFLEKPDDDGK